MMQLHDHWIQIQMCFVVPFSHNYFDLVCIIKSLSWKLFFLGQNKWQSKNITRFGPYCRFESAEQLNLLVVWFVARSVRGRTFPCWMCIAFKVLVWSFPFNGFSVTLALHSAIRWSLFQRIKQNNAVAIIQNNYQEFLCGSLTFELL